MQRRHRCSPPLKYGPLPFLSPENVNKTQKRFGAWGGLVFDVWWCGMPRPRFCCFFAMISLFCVVLYLFRRVREPFDHSSSAMRATLRWCAPFKSVLRRHKNSPDGLPFYNEMSKQWLAREGERWWIIDGAGEQLPRVASVVAQYITGQHRADFTPGVITGDQVIITNVKDMVMVGDDWLRIPITWQTQYPGGKYRVRLSEMYDRDPCMVMWHYLQKEVNFHFRRKLKTRSAPLEKAWLYEGSVHPHMDKNPRPLPWADHSLRREKWVDPTFQRRWTTNEFMQ